MEIKEIKEIKAKLKEKLSNKRYKHSIGVMETSIKLAEYYEIDSEEAALAGLLHDCARDIGVDETFKLCEQYGIKIDEVSQLQPELLHGPLGRKLAQEVYGVESVNVLEAIAVHTLGLPGMSLLSKIVFVADSIEPGRDFPEVDSIRMLAMEDLERAVLLAMDSAIKHVIKKNRIIHPDSVHARNFILRCIYEKQKKQ